MTLFFDSAPSPGARLNPPRTAVAPADTWDLGKLFESDQAWEAAFGAWENQIKGYAAFVGQLGDSAEKLASCLKFDLEVDRNGQRLGVYASLRAAEDSANSHYQGLQSRFRNLASRAAEAASFLRPEVMALGEAKLAEFLESETLTPYRLLLTRWARYRPHTLSEKEERLLAMQGEMAETAQQVFRQWNDADAKFGFVTNERGERVELSHATFGALLHSPSREVRETTFHQYYRQFAAYENTLTATLAGSIQRDLYYAKARGYPCALAAALFPDQVPVSVYENLISAVRASLPTVHRYYETRRRKMGLKEIRHYDTYVPILSDLEVHRTWSEAVELTLEALAPLGDEYRQTLAQGLRGRWCDRYENQGKHSGAFSCGSFDGDPYILMNYRSEILDHVFTLAHEAGHSMHSWYSARQQPYAYHDYSIFVAEVASTFNEQLLSRWMSRNARSREERAFLVNRELDSLRATIVRQTMFAEFEQKTHALAEANEPLTVERFKAVYRELLEAYFGPRFTLDDELSLECFRIPHFYRAFYVYKYATGLSAAIALAERVTQGGNAELNDYLGFLSGGCSKDPLDLLRGAGVNMECPEPIEAALAYFGRLVDELDELLPDKSS